MLLTIDVGNTSTELAVFKGKRIVWRRRMPTPPDLDASVLQRLLSRRIAAMIDRSICSSVVPRLDRRLKKAVHSLFGHEPRFVTHEMNTGFTLDIDEPAELGADRICGCAGALTICRPPLLVIDSGTATTFDLVNRRRVYIGGTIMPGLEISLRALAENAAKLKKISFRIPATPVGKNTADQIRAGIYYGFLGTLIHMIGEYRKILGCNTTVIATGGLSRLFHGRARGIDRYEPDLLFLGMRFLAENNP